MQKKHPSSDVNLNSGLIAYYLFNGNANNASGNNLNGTINGGVTFSNDIHGKANSAATFDGSSGYISIPDSLGKFQTNAITISLLVNIANPSIRQAFVSHVNFSDGSGFSYNVVISTASTNLPGFGVETNTLSCGMEPYDPTIVVYDGNQIVANKWYNFTCIFSDSLQEIFVNGTLNTAVTRNFPTLNKCTSKKALLLGSWWSGDQILLNGMMDEVRIYNRALNQDEISALAKPV